MTLLSDERGASPKRLLCFGELLLRLDAGVGSRLEATPALAVYPGGAEANVAASLARLGVPCALATVLPDTPLGRRGLIALGATGVDLSSVHFVSGRMGLYFVEPGAVRRPSQVLYDRAGSAFEEHVAQAFDWTDELARSRALHVSGVTPAIGPGAADAVDAALEVAVATGTPVSFDGNFRPRLWARWTTDPTPALRRCFAAATTAFANDRDFSLVLGQTFTQSDPAARGQAAAEAAFAAFPRLERICFTVRRQESVENHQLSAHLITRSTALHSGPVRLTGVIDRIGGGDAFAAGVLAGVMKGWSDDRSLAFGLAAAGLKHSVIGDFNPFNAAEIEAAMEEDGYDIRR